MPRRLILGALTMALAACGGSSTASTSPSISGSPAVTINGTDQVVSRITDASRIVSLSGDITEILFALDRGESIVGIDVTTVYPDAAAPLPIVGVGRFVTAEGVLSQNPTLVIGDSQSGPIAVFEQLRTAGVPVVILPVATNFAELYDKIATLGEIVDKQEAAATLSASIAADVESAIADVPSGTDLRIAYIYTRGPDVVLLFGNGMVSNPVITAAGAIDAGADSGIDGSIAATAEGIVAAAPDVIVVPEEGFSILGGIEAFLDIPGIAQTKAGETRRIYAYPEGDFLTFGPRIADSIRLLIADLYSDS